LNIELKLEFRHLLLRALMGFMTQQGLVVFSVNTCSRFENIRSRCSSFRNVSKQQRH